MQKVKKAIIPVAGYGTRFLPATKSQPKEMLPIVDKPVIQYIVEAAVAAGITEIIIVTNSNKRAVEDHFDRSPELEKWLAKDNKVSLLKELRRIPRMANFIYIRQKGGYGTAVPVLNAEPLIGDEPFAVFYGDQFFTGKVSWIKQMINVYERYHDPVIALTPVNKKEVGLYGIAAGHKIDNSVIEINSLVEKPKPQEAKSNLASFGGFILTPDIFPIIKKLKSGKGGEYWLSDAVKKIMDKRAVYGCLINGKLYDTGTVSSWLIANIEFALKHPLVKSEINNYLKKLK